MTVDEQLAVSIAVVALFVFGVWFTNPDRTPRQRSRRRARASGAPPRPRWHTRPHS